MGRGLRSVSALTTLVGLLFPLAAAGQAPTGFTADLVQPPATPSAPPAATPAAVTSQALVQWFDQACVATEGRAGAAIDWALSQGFAPVDALSGAADGVLDGRPGTVLAAPGTEGRVVLAAADGQCTLWIERADGPPLRQALAAWVGARTAQGAKARVEVERSVERAGAWRGQVQWRYRAVGAGRDLGVGAVTTLASGPGTQVLHVAPLAPAVRRAPDGLPAP